MQLVELGPLTQEDWDTLVAGEHDPFGPIGAGLQWRDKELNLALRDERGQLIAAAGAVLAEVRIAGGRPLPVVGLGGVIVTSAGLPFAIVWLIPSGLMTRLCDTSSEISFRVTVSPFFTVTSEGVNAYRCA